MKILHLTFQNLNSLTGQFAIDFADGPLAEAGIFAITGPTGAGKSTILDAITLALFGKAARYDTSKPEDMMSRGTGECFAEVMFQVNGDAYTARWDLTRARKKPNGNLQNPKRQLADRTGTLLTDKIREVDEMVTALTGLDYPRFLRSVLLAQGRFREFLDANAKDRGELLERITGTEIYSAVSVLAHEAAREKEEAVKEARTAANLIRLLTDEEKEGFAREREALTENEGEVSREIRRVETRLKCHAEHTALLASREALRLDEKRLSEAETGFADGQMHLTRHDKAAPLQGDLSLWVSKREAVARLESLLAGFKGDEAKAREAAAQAFAAASASCAREITGIETLQTAQLEKKSALTREMEALTAWRQSHRSDEGVDPALGSIREAAGHYQSAVTARDAAQKASELTRLAIQRTDQAMAQAEKELAEARKALCEKEASVKAVTAALTDQKPKKTWVDQKEAAETRRATLQELARLGIEHRGLTEETAGLQREQAAQLAHTATLKSQSAETARALETARRTLADKELIHTQAMAMASLEERRRQLVPGQECPLCGSTHHPFAEATFPKPSETETALTRQQREVAALEKRENTVQRDLSATDATLRALASQLSAKTQKCAELSDAFLALTAQGRIDVPLGDVPRLDALKQETHTLLIAIGEKIAAIEALDLEKNRAEKELIAARGNTNERASRLVQLKESRERDVVQLGTQSQHLTRLEEEAIRHLTAFACAIAPWNLVAHTPETARGAVLELEKRAAAWRKSGETLASARHEETKMDASLETLRLQIARIQEEQLAWLKQGEAFGAPLAAAPGSLRDEAHRRAFCEKAVQTLRTLEARVAQAANDTADATKAEAELRAELNRRLSERGFESIDALRLSLLDEERRGALLREKERLATEKVRLTTLTRQTDEALAKLAETAPPSDEEAETLATQKADLDTARDALLTRMGEINAALVADQNARREQAQQIARIETLETEAHPWLVLKDLIGSADGSKFARFAQGLTLGQLVNLANRNLAALNPRYEIQRIKGEDLDLEIVDRYQADAVRPTKSLSGGESFLVSLALALGLSEMAGQKTRIESLFIDEGFGSLDSDTLDTALAALENLRLDNRTIGVISHVDLLKHRLGTQIEVTRKADGHSTLAVVDG